MDSFRPRALQPIAGHSEGGLREVEATTGRQPQIVIVSDSRLYREGLALSLARIDRVAVVGSAGSLVSAIACIADTCPDVVLLDISMVGGLTLPSALGSTGTRVKIIAFSVAETENEICACAEAGIAGYISRDGSAEDLVSAVESTMRGEVLCPPRVVASLFRRLAQFARTIGQPGPGSTLTGREHEILALIDKGLSNKQIARQLRISIATVKNHIHNLLDKLGVRRRGEAVAVMREAAAKRATIVAGTGPTGAAGRLFGEIFDQSGLRAVLISDEAGAERHSRWETDLIELGLSSAEARLAAALMQGKRLSAIAADLGVSVTALRTQQRSVLKKVGAARQSDLVRILSRVTIGSVSVIAQWLDVCLPAVLSPCAV
jgi:two-component system nitrate/nitrite response regulator NarL